MCIELTKNERDAIDAVILDAASDLGVSRFDFHIKVDSKDKELEPPDEYMVAASIIVDYRCLSATITLYHQTIEKFREDPQWIVHTLYHEVAHVVTNRFKDMMWELVNLDRHYERACIDAHENTTEILGRLALKYRQSFDESYREKKGEGGLKWVEHSEHSVQRQKARVTDRQLAL